MSIRNVISSSFAPLPFFITEWRTTTANETITLPLRNGFTNNFVVDWGDGSSSSVSSYDDPNRIHEYATAGSHLVSITGLCGTFFFNNGGDAAKFYAIVEGGSLVFETCNNSFYGTNLESMADGGYTTGVTDFAFAWRDCPGLTSFPIIDTSSGTNFASTWRDCTGLTSFPVLDFSSATSLSVTWFNCSSLTSFPLIETGHITSFSNAWNGCTSLTTFPLLDTSSVTSLAGAWQNCNSIATFPLINTSSVTNFTSAWYGCFPLTEFPSIDTSSGEDFLNTWRDCTSLTTFPSLDFSSGTNFSNTWNNCALDQNSVDIILQSLVDGGQTGAITASINGGTSSPPSAAGLANKNTLEGRGWTVIVNT